MKNFEPGSGQKNLSADILTSFAINTPNKMTEIYQNSPDTMNSLSTFVFENATQEDTEALSNMIKLTPGQNSSLLLSNMLEANPRMVSNVYNSLTEEKFDVFNHMESGMNIGFEDTALSRSK